MPNRVLQFFQMRAERIFTLQTHLVELSIYFLLACLGVSNSVRFYTTEEPHFVYLARYYIFASLLGFLGALKGTVPFRSHACLLSMAVVATGSFSSLSGSHYGNFTLSVGFLLVLLPLSFVLWLQSLALCESEVDGDRAD